MTKWEVEGHEDGSQELKDRMKEGWEPFAAVVETREGTDRHHEEYSYQQTVIYVRYKHD